jgi:hypothetical protein
MAEKNKKEAQNGKVEGTGGVGKDGNGTAATGTAATTS